MSMISHLIKFNFIINPTDLKFLQLRAEGKAFICNGPLDELMNDLKLPPGPTVGFVFMVKIQECRE